MARTPPGRTREKVFRWVRRRLLEGQPPTVREVQAAMGFGAVESARKQLEALVAEGRLEKEPGRSRGYRLPGGTSRRPLTQVPVLGEVRAGEPTLAVQEASGWIAVEPRRRDDELFALEVRGDSMIGAGILAGDLVVVRRQSTARSGELVVAMIDDEATVKTLVERRGRVELHAANPAYPALRPDPRETLILGVVIEVRRRVG